MDLSSMLGCFRVVVLSGKMIGKGRHCLFLCSSIVLGKRMLEILFGVPFGTIDTTRRGTFPVVAT